MTVMKPYVVRQGDCLARLAHERRFDPEEVWNHGENRALKAKRPDPEVLAPGDVLRVPARSEEAPLELTVGGSNRYAVKVPRVKVSVVFSEGDEVLANQDYAVEGLGETLLGTSDGEGRVTLEVPVHVREVRVVFPEKLLEWAVCIGDLDPLEEPSGARQRLAHLGFEGWALGEAALAPLPEEGAPLAVRAFQRARGLPDTGALDDATRAELKKVHGG